MGDRRRGAALIAFVAAAVWLTVFAAAPALATHAPERRLKQGDDCPFPLAAPWPAGQVWMAGNGGSYYGDGAHLGSEFYAVDFNRIDGEDAGQPVYAAADGVVEWAGWLDGYGNCVILAHRMGVHTTYAHFQHPPVVSVGEPVTTATVLGYCGSTGNSTGPHLHFSVRVDDVSLKPEPMEGRRLFDGIFIVSRPKPEAAGHTPVLADLLRTPAPELSGELLWAGTTTQVAPAGTARGGSTGRPHLPH
jgi:hypothetical protein